MIDLSYTRAGMLAELDAPNPPGDSLSDITDPRVTGANVHVCVRGRERDDLFPILKIALGERFAAAPRAELIRDMLVPLKNALGNAENHGNRRDSGKAVSVELVLTRRGALIAVRDEGAGFDVARTFRLFREQETYFVNHGSGFRNLHRAKSIVSYENNGRTLLLCYRPATKAAGHGSRLAAAAPNHDAGTASPHALDPEWIKTSLSGEFAQGRSKIESCRVYPARGSADDDCGNRYVLRFADVKRETAETRIFTGRVHATEAEAEADFDTAGRLREAKI